MDSNIFVSADWHVWNHRMPPSQTVVGVNSRASDCLEVIEAASKLVGARGGIHIGAGDIFDAPRPSPQLLAAFVKALQPLIGGSGAGEVRQVLLVGNHDRVSTTPGDHALAPLSAVPGMLVVDTPTVVTLNDVSVLLVPPPPKGEDFEPWLEAAYAEHGQAQVLVVHAGIEDNATPAWLRGSKGSIPALRIAAIAKSHGTTKVFAGDWHNPRRWGIDGVRVVQCGALVPTGWDNPGEDYGRVSSVDRPAFWSIPGPRFLVAETVAEAKELMSAPRKGRLYLRTTLERGADFELRKAELQEEAVAQGVSLDVGSGIVASGELSASVRRRVQGSVDKAISITAKRLTKEDEVTYRRVVSLASDYLSGGSSSE